MPQFERITIDPSVMSGQPCIRGMRVTMGTVVGLIAGGTAPQDILAEYPCLEAEDIEAAVYSAELGREHRS